jgi:steroid 5-alpha reductase family enzyme
VARIRVAVALEVDVNRSRSFAWILAAHLAALAAAFAVARGIGADASPYAVVAWADLAATLVMFAFSALANNTSVYDPYWSVAPLVIAPWIALHASGAGALGVRGVLVVGLVYAWGLRLTYHWIRGFAGLSHEDWRYVEFRQKLGRLYWPMSLLGLHVFPTIQVYLGCVPLFVALSSARPLGPLDALATLVTAGAVVIEAVADEQLRAFRRAKRGQDEIMARGLWAYSRHPNYFGEVSFWWGLYLFALAAAPAAWWAGAGALSITLMFALFSIPALDRRSAERRPAYRDHMKRVSALVPWFPRR